MSTKATVFGLPKLPQKALFFLIPLFLSCFMSCIISFISVINSIGLNEHTVHAWLYSWGLAWLVGFPTVLCVLPVAKKLAMSLVKMDTH